MVTFRVVVPLPLGDFCTSQNNHESLMQAQRSWFVLTPNIRHAISVSNSMPKISPTVSGTLVLIVVLIVAGTKKWSKAP